jgi:hypothetical protein
MLVVILGGDPIITSRRFLCQREVTLVYLKGASLDTLPRAMVLSVWLRCGPRCCCWDGRLGLKRPRGRWSGPVLMMPEMTCHANFANYFGPTDNKQHKMRREKPQDSPGIQRCRIRRLNVPSKQHPTGGVLQSPQYLKIFHQVNVQTLVQPAVWRERIFNSAHPLSIRSKSDYHRCGLS